MVGPTDKSNNSPINTVSDTEPLNTLGTANTNMNLHPGFLDLINGTVNRNISPKDVIPTIPPADTPLDSDSVDSTTDDLKQAAQKLQDMLATFQAAYDGAKNRNPSAVLLLNLGNQMVDLINGWMTMSFEQMLAQLTMTLSLAEEIAKQQQDQAEETKKSSEYAAIGQIVSGAAGLTMAVGTLAVQTYKEARATSAEKELTEAEVPAGQAAGLPALEAEQVSLSQDIAKNSEEQATLTKTLESAKKSANDLTTDRDQAEDQLENDTSELKKTLDLYRTKSASVAEMTTQKDQLETAFSSYNKAEIMTGEQKTLLKNTLLANGLDPKLIDSVLEDPTGNEAVFFSPEIKKPIETAISTMNEKIASDKVIIEGLKSKMTEELVPKMATSQETLQHLEDELADQNNRVEVIKDAYNKSVKTGENLEASQKTNDEAIERTKAAIKTATKDQATKATSARQKAERFMAAGGPAQILTGAIQNVTTLITGAFNIVSADKKYNADMIAATITKLQAQSSAASQYMSTSKSQYDNYLQSLLTILSKLSDAMSSNTQAGR